MNLVADPAAGGDIACRCGADFIAREFLAERLPLEDRHGLPSAKTKLGVETQRAVVKPGLKQAHASCSLPARAIEDILHQSPTDAAVLPCRIDGDRPDAGNAGALVEKVAADDAAPGLGDDRIDAGMRQQHRHEATRCFWRGKIWREVMGRADRLEGFIADGATGHGVGCDAGTKNDAHPLSPCLPRIVEGAERRCNQRQGRNGRGAYPFGQGKIVISGPRSSGEGTWASEVTFGCSDQSSARRWREQKSWSWAWLAVRLAISVTNTSTLACLRAATSFMLAALLVSSGLYLARKAAYFVSNVREPSAPLHCRTPTTISCCTMRVRITPRSDSS